MNTRRTLLAALVFALLALALVATGCTKVVTAPAGSAANTVTASGSGKVSAAPDQAMVSAGATSVEANAKTALDHAAAAAKKLTAALVKAGVAEKDIQTANVNVYPNYAGSGPKPRISGYTASISVQAKVRDLAKLGDVISAVNDAGATDLGGPSFSIDEDSAYRAQAIDKAVADARKNAQAMAKASGRTLGGVLAISQSAVNVPVPMLYGDTTLKAGGVEGVPISPGQLDVTADVTVIFELK
jgi:uncharacterized protein YggE